MDAAISLSDKEHKSLYVDRRICIDFIHVCQGFHKENLCWHNRSVPKTIIKLEAAPTLSRELFLPGLFIVEIAFIQWFLRFVTICTALTSTQSLCLLSPLQVVCCATNSVRTVCMSVYIHMCTCQVCIKASSIQLMMEKEVPSSCESRHRPTPLYRCEYILFCVQIVYKYIHRWSVSLLLLCTVLFSRHIWVSVFPHRCHEHSEPHEALYCTQSVEGQIKLIETHPKLCSVPFLDCK